MRPKTVSTAILLVIAIAIMLMLFSCAKDYVKPTTQKINYSFSVSPVIKGEPFKASIHWGVNGLQFSENVNSYGFGSSVELAPGESLTINIESASGLTVIVNEMPSLKVTSGQIITITR